VWCGLKSLLVAYDSAGCKQQTRAIREGTTSPCDGDSAWVLCGWRWAAAAAPAALTCLFEWQQAVQRWGTYAHIELVLNGLLVHCSSTDEQDTQTFHEKFMLH
jgi:hypothetical protein